MRRPIGLASLAVGLLAGAAGTVAGTTDALADWPPIGGYPASTVVGRTLLVVAVAGLVYGSYLLAVRVLTRSASKRRAHNVRNLLRLSFGAVGTVATLAVATENWRSPTARASTSVRRSRGWSCASGTSRIRDAASA